MAASAPAVIVLVCAVVAARRGDLTIALAISLKAASIIKWRQNVINNGRHRRTDKIAWYCMAPEDIHFSL